MALDVTVDFPALPKGTEMDLGGLLVKNGEKTEVDEDAELAFVTRHQQTVKDWAGDGPYVKVSGSGKLGPAAVEKMFPPVEVSTAAVVNPYVEPDKVEPTDAAPEVND